MKIFCCYTNSHLRLFNDYFKPSVPIDMELMDYSLDLVGRDEFLSPQFLECIIEKVKLIIQSLVDNLDQVIVWSDIDIIFFKKKLSDDLLSEIGDADIAFQQEGYYTDNVNTGFFIVRSSELTIDFFKLVLNGLIANPGKNEEALINQFLKNVSALKVRRLPRKYYCRTFSWPPPNDMVLYHANETFGSDGIGQKIKQFKHIFWVKKYGVVALLISCVMNSHRRFSKLCILRRFPWRHKR